MPDEILRAVEYGGKRVLKPIQRLLDGFFMVLSAKKKMTTEVAIKFAESTGLATAQTDVCFA